MSKKSDKIADLIDALRGRELDARYLAYFECFNRQLFFEAHEVLEELWLVERGGPRDLYYKGLIQLAGAFVHVERKRLQPAVSLLRLAQTNLSKYPAIYESLETDKVCEMIEAWITGLRSTRAMEYLLSAGNEPKLVLRAFAKKDVRSAGLPHKPASL